MADRGFLKTNLKYHRIFVICIVFISIWMQYNFYSPKQNYSNGQIKVIGEKVNGRDEGIWTWYHPNGIKQMEGAFKNGKRSGKWIVWDSRGRKVNESTYIEDKLNGESFNFDINGIIIQKKIYKNDNLLRVED